LEILSANKTYISLSTYKNHFEQPKCNQNMVLTNPNLEVVFNWQIISWKRCEALHFKFYFFLVDFGRHNSLDTLLDLPMNAMILVSFATWNPEWKSRGCNFFAALRSRKVPPLFFYDMILVDHWFPFSYSKIIFWIILGHHAFVMADLIVCPVVLIYL